MRYTFQSHDHDISNGYDPDAMDQWDIDLVDDHSAIRLLNHYAAWATSTQQQISYMAWDPSQSNPKHLYPN